MGLDTKTYCLPDRQSQCDFNFGFDFFVENSVVSWRSELKPGIEKNREGRPVRIKRVI
jgi:hypothetical protein